MSGSAWDARIATWNTAMLVVSGLLVVSGFVLPSPEVEPKAAPGYRSMAAPAKPVRLVVPSLKIRAPILPIEVSADAVLDPPRNPRDIGWWQRSARPGAPQGQTVLTGHTVHTGGGVMDNIGRIRKGKIVKVVTPKGTMEYSATRVVTWSKAKLAERAVSIFSQDRGGRRLVLITCTDWNGKSYDSNVVVFAKPLGVREKVDKT